MALQSKRIVWITGAGSGIGEALSFAYADNGDEVILSGRNEPQLIDLQSKIRGKKGLAHVAVCDVRNEVSINEAARTIIKSVGIPEILANNAGVTVFKKFLDTTTQEFDDIIGTNLRGPFLTAKALLPQMIERGTGLILNIVSFAVKTTYTESSAYAASKAGVAALMEGLRAEVRGKGIKILNVFPGAVLTPIWHEKVRNKLGSRMMTPEELARLILEISCQPPSLMVEEIVIRPQLGDINA